MPSKLLIILLLFSFKTVKADEDLLEGIKPFVECIKFIINNGIEELEIPPLSKIPFPEVPPIHIEDYLLKGTYIFKDIILGGLSDFDMNKADLGVAPGGAFKLNYNFTLHGLRLTTAYDFDGKIVDVALIKGKGDLDITLGVDLHGTIIVKLGSNGIEFKDVQIYPTVRSRFLIPGLTVGKRMSKLIGRQLDSIIVDVVKLEFFQELFSDSVGGIIKLIFTEDVINLPPEIIEIIFGKCDFSLFKQLLSERVINTMNPRVDL